MKRRAFLVAAAAAAAGSSSRLDAEMMSPAEPVVVLYAGSLVTVMENVIRPALALHGLEFRGEAKGSLALANLIASGLRRPDVFISADPKVIEGLMRGAAPPVVTWCTTFATTRLVIGYAPASPFAPEFVAVARGRKKITEVLVTPGLRLGRTDPALDPKGYRTILAARLLEAEGVAPPGFAARLLGADRDANQMLPEETLLARLETGDLDAAFLYAVESVSRKLPFVELPASANFGDPARAAQYARASVTIDGVTHTGAPAAYALTIPVLPEHAPAAATFVVYLLAGDGRAMLSRAGLRPVPPTIVGDRATVPAAVLALTT